MILKTFFHIKDLQQKMKTSNKFNGEVKLYGLDRDPKDCFRCNRQNHSKNTVCWYCNECLDEKVTE